MVKPKAKPVNKKPKHNTSERDKPDNQQAPDTVKEAPGLSLVNQEKPPSELGKVGNYHNSPYPSKLASIRKLQERRKEQYNNLISKMF